MNTRLYKYPLMALGLYLIIVAGMVYSEGKVSNLYTENVKLLGRMQTSTPAEQKALMNRFKEQVGLTGFDEFVLKASAKGQQAVDLITPGRPHCLLKPAERCGTYTEDMILASQSREDAIKQLSGKEPASGVLNGTPYGIYDYLIKIALIVIEAAIIATIVSIIVLLFKTEEKPEQ